MRSAPFPRRPHERPKQRPSRRRRRCSLAVHNPNNPALAKLKEELAAREFKVREFLVSKKVSSGCSRATPTSHSLQNQKRGVSRRSRNAPRDCLGSTTRAALEKAFEAATAEHSLDRVSLIMETLFAGAFAPAPPIFILNRERKTLLRLRIDGLLSDIYFLTRRPIVSLIRASNFSRGEAQHQ